MNIEVLKYSVKVWLASFILSIPISIGGVRLFGIHYKEFTNFMFDYYELAWFALGRMLVFGIPFLLCFIVLNELLNRKSTNSKQIKMILTGIGIITLIILFLGFSNDLLFLLLSIANVLPIVFVLLCIVFIWIFKLDKVASSVDLDHILDA